MMTIGEAASMVDMPTKTVRYYADIALVSPSARSEAGYRLYTDREIRKLLFVRRARRFGFSVDDCRELLGLFEDGGRSSRDVKQLTLQRVAELESRMRELQLLHDELSHLAQACQGDDRPDCPIIDSLADQTS